MDNIQQLKQWIDGSDRIVFFGGAGVSTASRIFAAWTACITRSMTIRPRRS